MLSPLTCLITPNDCLLIRLFSLLATLATAFLSLRWGFRAVHTAPLFAASPFGFSGNSLLFWVAHYVGRAKKLHHYQQLASTLGRTLTCLRMLVLLAL